LSIPCPFSNRSIPCARMIPLALPFPARPPGCVLCCLFPGQRRGSSLPLPFFAPSPLKTETPREERRFPHWTSAPGHLPSLPPPHLGFLVFPRAPRSGCSHYDLFQPLLPFCSVAFGDPPFSGASEKPQFPHCLLSFWFLLLLSLPFGVFVFCFPFCANPAIRCFHLKGFFWSFFSVCYGGSWGVFFLFFFFFAVLKIFPLPPVTVCFGFL